MSASDFAVEKKNKTYISNRKKHSARRGETNSSKQIFSIQKCQSFGYCLVKCTHSFN